MRSQMKRKEEGGRHWQKQKEEGREKQIHVRKHLSLMKHRPRFHRRGEKSTLPFLPITPESKP